MSLEIGEELWSACKETRGGSVFASRHKFCVAKGLKCLADFWKNDSRNVFPRLLVFGAEHSPLWNEDYLQGVFRDSAESSWRLVDVYEEDLLIRGFTGYTIHPTYDAKNVDTVTIGQAISLLHTRKAKWEKELKDAGEPTNSSPVVRTYTVPSVRTYTVGTPAIYQPVRIGTYDRDASVLDTLSQVLDTHE